MPAELGHGLGVVHDHRTSPYVLHAAYSQLHTATVLHADASLLAILWVLLPRGELVPATRTMLFWHQDTHRLL